MADRLIHVRPGLLYIDKERKKDLAAFQKSLGIRFKSVELLNLSFIHRSFSNESQQKLNNERLEFLGDAILGAVTATLLYTTLPAKSEGELAKIKSVVVSEDTLAGIAREIELDSRLILGKGEELSGGRRKKALLADALEALIGAYCLDSGYDAAFSFVRRCIGPEIERVVDNKRPQDYKTLLQEYSQKTFHAYPDYRLVKRSGPDHERFFWIEVVVNGKSFGPGSGKTKKTAEQEAARAAYTWLTEREPE